MTISDLIHTKITDILEMNISDIADIATAIGGIAIPIAVISLILEQRKDIRNRRTEAYANMAREYRDYLKLCIEHSDLRVYDYELSSIEPQKQQEVKKMIIWDFLVSLMESAYFLYKDQDTKFKETQWKGWQMYAKDWLSKPDFLDAWISHLGDQYDTGFMRYMNGIIKSVYEINILKTDDGDIKISFLNLAKWPDSYRDHDKNHLKKKIERYVMDHENFFKPRNVFKRFLSE